jgi:hypothetical protein
MNGKRKQTISEGELFRHGFVAELISNYFNPGSK